MEHVSGCPKKLVVSGECKCVELIGAEARKEAEVEIKALKAEIAALKLAGNPEAPKPAAPRKAKAK